ncbi:MAG TPA: hypothetical protein VKX31_07025 [Brumimicrobium sp.]|nr:hypothetical protein [Brumimicrobium sp.]
MKKTLFILFLWLSLFGIGQEQINAEVNYLNYDDFFENSSLTSNPVLPVLSTSSQVGYDLIKRAETEEKRKYLTLFPVVDGVGSYFVKDSPIHSFNGGFGIGISTQLTSKFYARAILIGNYRHQGDDFQPFYSLYRTDFLSFGEKQQQRFGFTPQIRLSYAPYDFLTLQAGIDQHFIGHGNRSMLLGDYGAPYPFVQLRTKIWRIEMTNLYQFLKEEKGGRTIKKFASTHFFNYNITPRLQIGLFESVVFAAKDTLMNTGYEVAYLNPFLFYRPTEYELGSQDRLVIGLNLSYEFDPIMIYGQFVLDEFVLKELRERSRWWANKYGGQIGVKGKGTMLDSTPFRWLVELNFARPFVYSHYDVNIVYGNQGRPLAHPLGSNFVEVYAESMLKFTSDFGLKARFFFVQQGGYDGDKEVSYGKDVYQPYINRPFDYGFHIGGNGKVNRYHFSLEGNYQISKKLKLEAFVRPGIEINNMQSSYQAHFLMLGGIRTALWNERSFSF